MNGARMPEGSKTPITCCSTSLLVSTTGRYFGTWDGNRSGSVLTFRFLREKNQMHLEQHNIFWSNPVYSKDLLFLRASLEHIPTSERPWLHFESALTQNPVSPLGQILCYLQTFDAVDKIFNICRRLNEGRSIWMIMLEEIRRQIFGLYRDSPRRFITHVHSGDTPYIRRAVYLQVTPQESVSMLLSFIKVHRVVHLFDVSFEDNRSLTKPYQHTEKVGLECIWTFG